jgi:transposase
MNTVALIGIDLGKHSFHLQAQDHNGRPLFRKQLSRPQLLRLLAQQPVCRAAMEACAGAHCLAREIQAQGHQPLLISPQFVRPFVQGNKNDFLDAQAICEAASRPNMRFVTPKTEVQQTLSVLHRLRESLIRDCTKSINQLHGFLLEFGISLPRGMVVMRRLATVLAEHRLPPRLVVLLQRLHAHFGYLDEQIKVLDRELVEHVEADDLGSRLLSIPGVGPITSSVLLTELGDARQYRSSRDFAASVGLVPRQHSTGGRQNLLGTSKCGDKNLRRLLADWVRALLCRRHSNVVACALANKLARIAWALAQGQGRFETGPDGCAA